MEENNVKLFDNIHCTSLFSEIAFHIQRCIVYFIIYGVTLHLICIVCTILEVISFGNRALFIEYRNGWLIKTVTKSFAVYAATATEKQEWMAHITKCIEDLLRKSGKKPVEVHAAVWVPDNEATICMHCNKTQFTVINRRHHCRQCGTVVCGPCSNKKLILPGQGGGKAVRVCLQCYDAASKVKATLPTTTDSLNSKEQQRNSADSSGGDSSGDEEEGNKEENHDEPKFYSTLAR